MKSFYTLERHPLSAAWGDMPEDDYQDLKDSLENIGLQNPIVMFEGQVIDGWHRYKACEDLGIAYTTVELREGLDPQYYVISTNARRNQTKAQKAVSLSEVYAWGRNGDNQHKNRTIVQSHSEDSRVCTECTPSHTTAEIAGKAGVSVRTVAQAKSVITKAAPEVVQAVKDGKIGLSKAEQIIKLPKDQQVEAINRPMPKAVEQIPEDEGPSEEELRAEELRDKFDREYLDKLLEADDKIKFCNDEIKRLNALLATVTSQRDGFMNGKAQLAALLKRANARIDKLEKQLGHVNAA